MRQVAVEDDGRWHRKPTRDRLCPSSLALASRISPEDVCLYESSVAGAKRLLGMGVVDNLDLSKVK